MWTVLAISLVVFWIPLLAVAVLSVRGIVQARRRLRGKGAAGGGPWRPLVAVLASGLGLVGAIISLQAWGEALGLGRYLPPERQWLLTLALAVPTPLAATALLASLGWLALALAGRRPPPVSRVAD